MSFIGSVARSFGRIGRGGQGPRSFKDVSTHLNKLGLEIADIDAVVTDCKTQSLALTEEFNGLAESAEAARGTNKMILTTVAQSMAVAEQTDRVAVEASGSFNAANEEIRVLIDMVAQITSQMESLQAALKNVRAISTVISSIATRTDVLALNAAVEAARAGEAGRGFAVVASEVKRLASQTSDATAEINSTLSGVNDEAVALIRMGAEASKKIAVVQQRTDDLGSTVKSLAASMGEVKSASARISKGANQIDRAFTGFVRTTGEMRDTITESAEALGTTAEKLVGVLRGADSLVAFCATSGIGTTDTPMIALARKTAEEVQAAMEAEVQSGALKMDDLFDRNYQLIPGSDPEQFMTRGTLAIERLIQDRLERLAKAEKRIAFAAAIDVNGYMPANLLKYSKPQGPDPIWNKANCRNRWIFKDRTGQACGKNLQPFLLQTYRRDMGGGQFVLMKDVSAPLHVGGRHWGGFRIAYKPE